MPPDARQGRPARTNARNGAIGSIRGRLRILALTLLLTACSPATTPPPPPTPQPTDVPTPTPRYSDAEQTTILRESIGQVYGTDPQPDWYAALRIIDGDLDVTVEDKWAYVGTTLIDVATAEAVCAAIAAATFDDEAQLIGVTDVMVGGAGNEILTDCDVR